MKDKRTMTKMTICGVYIVLCLTSYVLCHYDFRNTSLSWEYRVEDLVKRLTVQEMSEQMARGGGWPGGPAPAIPRLGIKPFQWNTECLRGLQLAGKATAFPQSINLGAMFSWRMLERVAAAIGSEVRAKANNYTAHGSYADHQGLNCWAPMINIMRHPLWGRNQEVYGEDPYLTGRLATAYVNGLQGNDSRYIQAAASCKAFVAYAGPEDKPVSRFTFDAVIPDRDLFLTYLPAFKQCVSAGAFSYMCSYNSVNGIPMCANNRILNDVLRNEWGFKGFVVSDLGAIEAIVEAHKYLNNTLDAVRAAVYAGCNLELIPTISHPYYSYIALAVQKGLITETKIRDMVKPLFYTRMKLGEFDPPSVNPYTFYNITVVQSQEHQNIAIEAATKSFVLLKNDNQLHGGSKVLPIKLDKYEQIAIVGPMADNLDELYGDYGADVDPTYASTPLQGLRGIAKEIRYGSGCKDNICQSYNKTEIEEAVTDVELIIVCLGTGIHVESEGLDRPDMDLPGKQEQVIADAKEYGGDAPIVLLLFSAGPVNISFADVDPRIPAILQCFFPAQATGKALFNTLTLATPNSGPAGRLPYTWYQTADQIPSMVNYSMEGKTYRYFDGVPTYPFGYGLSYTQFLYSNLVYLPTISLYQEEFGLSVDIRNERDLGSDEVVQVYISWLTTKEKMPRLQLVAFDRVFIAGFGDITVKFNIKVEQLAVWTDKYGFVVEEGQYGLYVGGQQPKQARTVASNVLDGKLTITKSWKVRKTAIRS